MQIRTEKIEDLIFIDKPTGVTTHSPGKGEEDGLVEYLSRKLACNLWVVHRLDKGTSGVQVFAQSKDDAANLSALFNQGKVTKQYIFITRHQSKLRSFEVSSYISKQGNSVISDHNSEAPNSFTKFEFEADLGGFYIWMAFPTTGKPHQIRLHAAHSDIPILGDLDHGRDAFPRLMLHAAEISFPWNSKVISKSSPTPLAFRNIKLLKNQNLLAWISEIEWRERFFELNDQAECLRLIQTRELGIRFDKLGEVLWVSDYSNSISIDNLSITTSFKDVPSKNEMNCSSNLSPKELLLKISDLSLADIDQSHSSSNSATPLAAPSIDSSSYHIVSMRDRGDSDNLTPFYYSNAPKTWVIQEGAIKFLLKSDHGFSSGIFIDQRANREWVGRNSSGKSVLNLFSYAGAFSVAAAVGGALSTLSVDTSNQANNWAKENFALNYISLDNHKFITDDVRKILTKFIKSKKGFDLIICDPPSFARSKGSVFSLDKELEGLIKDCFSILNPGGHLLFSMNLEKVINTEFKRRITRCVMSLFKSKISEQNIEFLYPDWDAGLPREEGRLKTVKISK